VLSLSNDLESSTRENFQLKDELKSCQTEMSKQKEQLQFQMMQLMQLNDKINVSFNTNVKYLFLFW
jgi:hypothetical protein